MSEYLGDFTFDYETGTRRRAYRVSIPGLFAEVHDLGQTFQVQDISASGVAIEGHSQDNPGLQKGQELKLTLLIKDKPFLEDLNASVVRSQASVVACEFQDLTFNQEAKLDKLVLEIQKKLISAKKKRAQDKNEEAQDTDS